MLMNCLCVILITIIHQFGLLAEFRMGYPSQNSWFHFIRLAVFIRNFKWKWKARNILLFGNWYWNLKTMRPAIGKKILLSFLTKIAVLIANLKWVIKCKKELRFTKWNRNLKRLRTAFRKRILLRFLINIALKQELRHNQRKTPHFDWNRNILLKRLRQAVRIRILISFIRIAILHIEMKS